MTVAELIKQLQRVTEQHAVVVTCDHDTKVFTETEGGDSSCLLYTAISMTPTFDGRRRYRMKDKSKNENGGDQKIYWI
jgi:hypothetical protein